MNDVNQTDRSISPNFVEIQEEEIDLREYLNVIIEAKWLVLGVIAAVFVAALIYTVSATPIFRSDVLLQIEDTRPTISGLDDISTALTGEVPAVTEIEIIRSRSVIGAAIDSLGLAILAEPEYFPIFGAGSARKHKSNEGLANPVWALGAYAWGGERINVQRLEVPREHEGKTLRLVAGEGGHYEISGPDNKLLVSGITGQLAETGQDEKKKIKVFIAELFARPGTRFKLIKFSRVRIIQSMQKKLIVKEKGKKSGILEMTLEGEDAKLTTDIVNSIAMVYLRQNAERKSVEAERTLKFITKQLPDLKGVLNKAETNLNSYREVSGRIDLTLETQGILEQMTELERDIQRLQLQKTKMKQLYTSNHPTILGLNKQIAGLNKEREKVNVSIKRLPKAEQKSVTLMRDVKVANELYLLLLNKSQELKVLKAGTVGNVRILDTAYVPENPVKPRKLFILTMSLFLGGMLAILAVFIRRGLFHGVEDSNLVENKFGVPVYANIMHSHKQVQMEKKLRKSKSDDLPVLALEAGEEMAIEALRSLRTSLQFALTKNDKNIIVFGGPSPGIGKSFISVNFAHVLADTDKKIVLVDGDMRKGHLHHYFSTQREEGLSEVLSGNLDIKKVLKKTRHKNVDLLTSGIIPPNPSELLTDDKFSELIEKLSKQYDFVIIDTPPLLAVTDAVITGRVAGIFFLILESRRHRWGEIEHSLKRMEHNGIKAQGIIMNNIKMVSTGYGYGYGYSYQ